MYWLLKPCAFKGLGTFPILQSHERKAHTKQSYSYFIYEPLEQIQTAGYRTLCMLVSIFNCNQRAKETHGNTTQPFPDEPVGEGPEMFFIGDDSIAEGNMTLACRRENGEAELQSD